MTPDYARLANESVARRGRSVRIAKGMAAAKQTAFMALLRAEGLPLPSPEFRFASPRKWAFDYCWPDAKLALEVDGGVWTAGRHTRGSGWLKDTEKLNAAACHGYRMLRCTPAQLTKSPMIATIRAALSL